MERVKGIEPSTSPWKGDILPVNYTRFYISLIYEVYYTKLKLCSSNKYFGFHEVPHFY